jgi:hypothetical protein
VQRTEKKEEATSFHRVLLKIVNHFSPSNSFLSPPQTQFHSIMQIHIKKLDGQKEEFSLEPTDSVMKVKEMLAEKTGVHKDQIRLIFKGKPMLDDKVRTKLTYNNHNLLASTSKY